MQLMLTQEEARELKTALESEVRKCFDELGHADYSRELRADLKVKADRLQALERRVGALLEEGEAQYA